MCDFDEDDVKRPAATFTARQAYEETIYVSEEVEVLIDEDGKVYKIHSSTERDGVHFGVEGNPHNPDTVVNVEGCLKCMMEYDLPQFKKMLSFIKETDPEFYNLGVKLLEAKKQELISEYTL